MTKSEGNIPEKAMQLIADGEIKFSESGDDVKVPKLSIVGYSGQPIKNHYYWDDLAIDLSGIKLTKKTYPVLEDHDTSRKIAFSKKPTIENGKLEFPDSGVTLLGNQYANSFLEDARKGFPFQASIYAIPSHIERLKEGDSAEVNGYTLKGPGTIWRSCELKEVSICVFGYDSNTSVTAMTKKEEPTIMDIKELKAQYPDLCNQILTEAEAKFADEVKKQQDKLAEMQETINGKDKQILQLEKDAEIRKETEMANQAKDIWTNLLTNSAVPQHLFAKVQKHVAYQEFVKEGVFDTDSFSKAITEEIKDWEDKGVTAKVIGGHFGKNKDATGEPDQLAVTKENEDRTNSLLKLAGVKI